MTRLIDRIAPCGPVHDPKAAERARTWLDAQAPEAAPIFDAAAPALAPVFGASPYLTSLARRDPGRLAALLEADPEARFEDLLARTEVLGAASPEAAKAGLRVLKAEAHLLIALADLGGAWDLDAVTGALARFADAALQTALKVAAREEAAAGRLIPPADGEHGPVPGYFCIAMGKHGA